MMEAPYKRMAEEYKNKAVFLKVKFNASVSTPTIRITGGP